MEKSKYWIPLIGLVIGALSYWRLPYSEFHLNELSMWLLVGSASFIGGFVSRLVFKQGPIIVGLFVMLGVLASIVLRIGYEVSLSDTSSHNMAPFEIIISALQSFPMALVGAYIAVLIKKL